MIGICYAIICDWLEIRWDAAAKVRNTYTHACEYRHMTSQWIINNHKECFYHTLILWYPQVMPRALMHLVSTMLFMFSSTNWPGSGYMYLSFLWLLSIILWDGESPSRELILLSATVSVELRRGFSELLRISLCPTTKCSARRRYCSFRSWCTTHPIPFSKSTFPACRVLCTW